MKRLLFACSRLLLVSFLVTAAASSLALDSPPQANPAQLKNWVETLAGDAMKGRMEGTEGAAKAATWLADQFAHIGLAPVPGAEGYFQPFSFEHNGKTIKARNVIGMIPGSDPALKDEWIMITAHYDHIGEKKDGEGDLIYNGADDNASGVAVAMAIGETLSRLNKAGQGPKRSILVIGWAAEEEGLHGSRWFAKNPLIALDKLVVNLNLEMVGHSTKLGPKKLWMTGRDYSDLQDVVATHAGKHGWEFINDPFPTLDLFVRSDNVPFAMLVVDREKRAAQGVPAHSFSTWGGEDHYHEVHDNPERVDVANMAALAEVMTAVTRDLADRAAWVNWKSNSFYNFSRYTGAVKTGQKNQPND